MALALEPQPRALATKQQTVHGLELTFYVLSISGSERRLLQKALGQLESALPAEQALRDICLELLANPLSPEDVALLKQVAKGEPIKAEERGWQTVAERREAVRELSGPRSETGRYERSAREVAEILGCGHTAVVKDRRALEAEARSENTVTGSASFASANA